MEVDRRRFAQRELWSAPEPGVVFIADLLRRYAVPRRSRFPLTGALLNEIEERWPGLVNYWSLCKAIRMAGLGFETLRRPKNVEILNFDLSEPVSRWRVPRPALAKKRPGGKPGPNPNQRTK